MTKISKQFIEEQKKKLIQDKIKILHQIETLRKEDPFADPEHASDNAAIDTDVREQVGHETIEAEIKDMGKRLVNIEAALKKMIKKRYGVCEKCNQDIPLARLKLLSEALYCIECEKRLRK